MKRKLGWLAYLLATAFALGVMATLVAYAWRGLSADKAGTGAVGFGTPMVLAGLTAGGLAARERFLRRVLGWTSALVGFASGLCLLACVAAMVRSSQTFDSGSARSLAAMGMGVMMILAGGAGIAWLVGAPGAEAPAEQE